MRLVCLLPLTAQLALLAGPWSGQLSAQQPSSRGDSSRTDSLHRRQCPDCLGLVFYALAIAPSALLGGAGEGDTATVAGGPLEVPDFSLSAYITGGSGLSDTSSWAHSENLELFARGAYIGARLEHIYEPRDKEYLTVRLGHLWRRGRMFFGGITAGYRATRGGAAHAGGEVAFPLVVGGRRWRTLFEVSYLFDGDGAYWNYRLQTQWPLRWRPLFIGFDCDLQNLPIRNHGQIETGALSLLLGIRR
jgi:hypothetical protein